MDKYSIAKELTLALINKLEPSIPIIKAEEAAQHIAKMYQVFFEALREIENKNSLKGSINVKNL